ncbi:hypothetical protein D9615_003265 [Tricholomella constricta]|uniref:RING-type domain-containing protein n=1 Tax=Tricholomella constricta TaxID=117010 RepID=A0A8H5HIY2_9AGAR|nr:hypothetical protein D9615_003265 [Tricholomella constricta]
MGSSSGSVVLPAPIMNSKKRGPSELDGGTDRPRSNKKLKKDDGVAAATKDKKRRRKRKRKAPVVATAAEPESRPRSKSRSVTVGTQSSAQEESPSMSVTPYEPAPKTEDVSTIDDVDDAMPVIPYADKGKGKAKEESPQPPPDSPKTQIARLKQELATQSLLLGRHQSQLTQVHQALTCQICLDKPFALAPCGHIVCHGCLVRWFTAPENPVLHPLEEPIRAPGVPQPSHVLKKKKCPICRAQVIEGLGHQRHGRRHRARSGLIELPAPLPDLSSASEASTSAGADPWRNIFRRHTHNRFSDIFAPRLPRYVNDPTVAGGVREGGLEELGMYDAEDGGIYRCIDCMHEIWDGVCSRCHREYPGHRRGGDEDDDDEDEDDVEEGAFRMGFGWRRRSRTLHDLLFSIPNAVLSMIPPHLHLRTEGGGGGNGWSCLMLHRIDNLELEAEPEPGAVVDVGSLGAGEGRVQCAEAPVSSSRNGDGDEAKEKDGDGTSPGRGPRARARVLAPVDVNVRAAPLKDATFWPRKVRGKCAAAASVGAPRAEGRLGK